MNGHVVLALLETLISCLGAQNPIFIICKGGINDGSVDVDVSDFGWSIMCPDDYQL